MTHTNVLLLTCVCICAGLLFILLSPKDPDLQDWLDDNFWEFFHEQSRSTISARPPKPNYGGYDEHGKPVVYPTRPDTIAGHKTISDRYSYQYDIPPHVSFVWSDIANTWTTKEEYEYLKEKATMEQYR